MRLTLLALVLLAVPARALDPHLPADTQTYVSIDLRKLIDSDLFKDNLLGPAKDALKALPDLADLFEDLGLDPFKHIDRAIVSSPGGNETDRGLLILHGTFDAAKLKAKADKLKKAKDEGVKIHEVPLGGGVKHDVYEIIGPADISAFVALASPKVLLLSPGKDYIIDALKQAKAGKKPTLKSKEMQEMIEGLDAKSALALAFPGKALGGVGKIDWLPARANEAIAAVEVVGGGVTVGDDFKLTLAISSKDADNAKTVRDFLKTGTKLALAGLAFLGDGRPELALAFDVVKSIKVGGKGRVVGVTAELKADTLKELFGKGR